MTMSQSARLFAGAASVAAMLAGGAAFAQQRAAAPAAAPASQAPLGGPVIPGVCIFSNQQLITQSSVGRAVIARMQQLEQAVNTELQPEQTAIQTEARAVQALPAGAARNQREQALATRAQAFQQRAAQRSRELQATQQKALARVATEAEPVVRQVYTQQRCGLLLDRSAIFGGNQQMDVTPAVVTGLNGRIQTFAFERERLDAQAAQRR
ncbi:MAG TPA: OmpH family outer membrane protein [Caulobacteraceae bacterium]|jgi:Skp family chaperone for outer membrane proteins